MTPQDISSRLAGLPGMDPAWSRVVEATDADGVSRAWHILDTHADRPTDHVAGTLLCVHGNPTWSYLWRRLLADPPAGWRVIAVDQLGMGFSEHPRGSMDAPRTLAQRIDDLAGLTATLRLDEEGSRVVVAGHDWGGMVASGWALAHRDVLAGLVLANTCVHHDFEAGLPAALRFSLASPALRAVTVGTPTFVRATTAVSSPRPPCDVQRAYALPYRTAAQREFVGQFVADIPTRPEHPTRATMDALASGLSALGAEQSPVPVLLLRGPKDPVFSEAHLRDLRSRLPHADVHRYEGASHLVLEDAPRTAQDIARWIAVRVEGEHASDPAARHDRPATAPFAVGTAAHPWSGLTDMAAAHPDALCTAEVATGRRVTFGEIDTDIEHVAQGLREAGMAPGDRVALLVEPGVDLTVAAYAVWRVGGVVVVADAGLGLDGMGRALRGAGVSHVIGMTKAVAALPVLRIPGRRFLVGAMPAAARTALKVEASFDELRARGQALLAEHGRLDVRRAPGDDAAVLFTSGATGPSKGVVYTLEQIRSQAGGFGHIYGLTPGGRLVAAFAPFALYGPALGVGGVVPDMKVTAPATLTAAALADAVLAAEGTTVFASPAALRNVARTAGDVTEEQRKALAGVKIVMSAGAPVPAALLRELVDTVFPAAEMHTPYGMTECLPVSDITLNELEQVYAPEVVQDGVCVGRPIESVQLAIAPLPAEHEGEDGALTDEAGVVGEICVRAPHMKDRYDQLWATDHAAGSHPEGWHRTGDVGHLDAEGCLWVEGRRVHVLHTARGPVTPVGLEQRVEALPAVENAAVVGVGPLGVQQVAVVVTLTADAGERVAPGGVLADRELHEAVRACAALPVAAVLVRDAMPVDIRHQSKIDRTELAQWAAEQLAGGRR